MDFKEYKGLSGKFWLRSKAFKGAKRDLKGGFIRHNVSFRCISKRLREVSCS